MTQEDTACDVCSPRERPRNNREPYRQSKDQCVQNSAWRLLAPRAAMCTPRASTLTWAGSGGAHAPGAQETMHDKHNEISPRQSGVPPPSQRAALVGCAGRHQIDHEPVAPFLSSVPSAEPPPGAPDPGVPPKGPQTEENAPGAEGSPPRPPPPMAPPPSAPPVKGAPPSALPPSALPPSALPPRAPPPRPPSSRAGQRAASTPRTHTGTPAARAAATPAAPVTATPAVAFGRAVAQRASASAELPRGDGREPRAKVQAAKLRTFPSAAIPHRTCPSHCAAYGE